MNWGCAPVPETTVIAGTGRVESTLASCIRRTWLVLFVGCSGFLTATSTLAENWRFSASASAMETYTSNVNYAAQGGNDSDFATSVSATLGIHGEGARVKLNGSIAATGLLYARQTQNNSIAPTVNLSGSVEAIEKFLFVDATASVNTTFFSPFGPQPGNIVNATANRYISQTYGLNPYIQGQIPGTKITYQLRDDNTWTLASPFGDASVETPNTYLNRLYASMTTPAAPLGWTLEYTGTRYQPSGVDLYGSYTIQIGRGILTYQFDPQLQVSVRGGYESTRFPLTGTEDVTYGLGGQWSPSDRTNVVGYWEHRFFGSSYSLQISHRLPRTAMSASFARGLGTYPQNSLSIPAGANVASYVDAAFTTRIPDPAERALAVQQFLAQSGLPATLTTPVNIFSVGVLLQDTASASFVLLGVRNSLAFNVFYTKSNAISGTGSVLPPALQAGQDNTQTGGGVSLSHKLSGFTNLTASATLTTTTSNTSEGQFGDARSTNAYTNLDLSTAIGPKTSVSTGVGYSRFSPSGGAGLAQSTSSVTAYAGISHTF